MPQVSSSTGGLGAASQREPIAIVGIACRYPQAPSPSALWSLLMARGDAIGEVPKSRFDLDALYDASPATPGKVMSRWGGFLEDIDRFDAAFFGISPREADRLDPQQRLLLEVGWEALEDAGHVSGGSERTGVFVGMWLNDYESLLTRDERAIDFYTTLGTGRYAASGRLSYVFGFDGPSFTLDTGASSSLVAIHQACQSLRSGESDMALAGGANVILDPYISIAYSQSKMLAPDGRCRFGDARGSGYVRSEGAGMVVLKRLSDATAAGDRVYAVILGSAVNNDGRSSGFLATPGREGQERMLRRAYQSAGIVPGRVQYVEAHGTGTPAGDPVELGALGAVLGEGRPAGARCRVGSLKTNIGHTEGAAGAAGLIKVALSLSNGSIPASLHFETPNPNVAWADLPIEVQSNASPWFDSPEPPVAGVSSFGIAGTNAHVVLQQHSAATPTAPVADVPRLFVLSSHSASLLRERQEDFAAFIEAGPTATFDDICYTAAARRAHQPHRFAMVATSLAELQQSLRESLAVDAPVGTTGTADETSRRVVFVFPGQGSQWIGMGRELAQHDSAFREALDACDRAIQTHTGWSVREVLSMDTDSRLGEIDVVQPVLFSVQVALAAVWRSRGIAPDAVVGHSMGEVAAAHVSGALSLDDAARVICTRSRLMRRMSGQGAMAVVELSRDEARRELSGYEDRLSVAVSNSRKSSVLSGEPAALDEVLEALENRGVFCRPVNVDVASHSPQMDPICGELRDALSGIGPAASAVPFYSTVQAGPVDGRSLTADYWVSNLRQPVLFGATVERLMADEHVTFVEMSPHPLLVHAVQEAASDAKNERTIVVGSTRRNEDERRGLLTGLGQLFVRGHHIAWGELFQQAAKVVSLPVYRYQRERFWYEASAAAGARRPAVVSDAGESASAPTQGPLPVPEPTIRERLTAAAPGRQRRQLMEQWIREQLAQVMRTSITRIDPAKAFRTMGLDSLMGTELRNRLQAKADVSMPVTVIWNHPTVVKLAPELAERMGIGLDAESAPPPEAAATDVDELDRLIGELEQLSNEEARRLVADDL